MEVNIFKKYFVPEIGLLHPINITFLTSLRVLFLYLDFLRRHFGTRDLETASRFIYSLLLILLLLLLLSQILPKAQRQLISVLALFFPLLRLQEEEMPVR